MAVKTDKFGVHQVANVYFLDINTGEPVLYFDTLKMSNLVTTAKVVDARGGQGNAKLMSFDFDKEATLTLSDALFDPKGIAMKHGTTAVAGVATVYARETWVSVTDSANSAVTVSNVPKESVANIRVYKPDGTTVVATALAAKKLTFAIADVPVGTQLVVYYTWDTSPTATTVSIDSDKFGGYYKVVGDLTLRNQKTKLDEPFQVVIAMAKLSNDTNIQMQADGDPQPIEFKLDVQKPADSVNMIKFVNVR
jgi:ATP:corrinoid adenosyltransferase